MTVIRFEVDLDGAGAELKRLQDPPTRQLEGVLMQTFAITEGRVHVITGSLKASGRTKSDFTGDVWSGTLEFDRYPGIFELARGPKRTRYHGGLGDSHFFFDPVEARWPGDWTTGDAFAMYTRVIENFLEG